MTPNDPAQEHPGSLDAAPHPAGSRRGFLARLPIAAAAVSALAGTAVSCSSPPRVSSGPAPGRPLRFGLIADVHHDIMHDGIGRVTAFVEAMGAERVEFIAQLGDFCWPHERNRPFLDAWNRYPGPRHHVLGNHDMDGGFRREQTVAFYGMPARHYGFSHRGLRFLVLDGNDPGGQARGYARFIAPDQADWLRSELASGTEPVVVLVHQALDHPQGIENRDTIRALLEGPRLADGSPRVLAVFSGHHHQDWTRTLGGIHYLQVNSASYQWVGERFAHDPYSPDVLRSRPTLRLTCPYRDPLWATVTLDPLRGTLTLEGRSTRWVGPSPEDLGVPADTLPRESTVPAIRTRRLRPDLRSRRPSSA